MSPCFASWLASGNIRKLLLAELDACPRLGRRHMGTDLGGAGRNIGGIKDAAASTHETVAEDTSIQAESSESSSGHSDKDWIRFDRLHRTLEF